jgi:uncharacterized membrane protein YjjP (DUF1212 family)
MPGFERQLFRRPLAAAAVGVAAFLFAPIAGQEFSDLVRFLASCVILGGAVWVLVIHLTTRGYFEKEAAFQALGCLGFILTPLVLGLVVATCVLSSHPQ